MRHPILVAFLAVGLVLSATVAAAQSGPSTGIVKLPTYVLNPANPIVILELGASF